MSRSPSARWLVVLVVALVSLGVAALAKAAPLADSAILFIGDGMGPVQIMVAREARAGEPLAMEKMPFSGLATTHSADQPVTDSAAAATALATGHKTNNGMISVAPDGRRLLTILEACQAMYKSTGIVTTDAPHGATPAAFASHVKNRGASSEIALQLARSRLSVMLGFSRDWFLPESAGGKRTDGRNLISDLRRAGYDVVFTKEALSSTKNKLLIGLFDDGPRAPALADMVTAALDRLRTDPDGFFLIAEAARIDWKCHDHDLPGALRDVWELDRAVAAALDFAREHPHTLVVVTADHETGGLMVEDSERLRQLGRKEGEAREAAIAALLSKRAGLRWGAKGHTATPVRVFAFGPGAERFAGEMDNTDIPKRIAEILGLAEFPQ